MWSYGVPDVGSALQGATVLQFASSLSVAICLSTLERYLAVVTALHYENLRKDTDTSKRITMCITVVALSALISFYLPLCWLAKAAYAIELTIQTLLPIITFGRVSYTSLHRSFAQPYQVMDKTGLFKMQYIETEAVGEISSQVYNSCTKERDWRGFWPLFYLELAKSEETKLEEKLEPFVRAVSESSGLDSTLMKAGQSLVKIGGPRLKLKASVADAIGAEVDQVERRITYSLGRMYDAYNIFYRINRVTLTDSHTVHQVSAFSDGQKVAKIIYRTSEYASAFRELAEQIQEYPLTLDISRSDEIEVVRSNVVLLKHMIGIVTAIAAAAWFGFSSILVEKDTEKSAYVLGLYALWVNLGYIPILGRDSVSFTDLIRVKRKRVIEAALHNKSYIGTQGKDSCWNYRKTIGAADLGSLSSEEAAIVAKMCQTSDATIVALDTCSLRSYIGTGKSSLTGTFEASSWKVDRTCIDCFGTNLRIGAC